MYRPENRFAILEAAQGFGDDVVAHPVRPAELLEIEWVHVDDADVPHGQRSHAAQFDAKQRPREHVVVTFTLHEILDCRDGLFTLLHLVDEDDGLAGNQPLPGEGRYGHEKLVHVARGVESVADVSLLYEVELDDVLVFSMEELPHQVRLANLTGPRNEEGPVAMLVSPRGELLKRFSPQHGFHLVICIFPSFI